MNAAAATTIAGIIVAVLSSVILPFYITRHTAAREAVKDKLDAAASEDLTWRSINAAIVKERDDLRVLLKNSEDDYAEKITTLREDHDRELRQLRERYDGKIQVLEATVDSLYRRLYENRTPP